MPIIFSFLLVVCSPSPCMWISINPGTTIDPGISKILVKGGYFFILPITFLSFCKWD